MADGRRVQGVYHKVDTRNVPAADKLQRRYGLNEFISNVNSAGSVFDFIAPLMGQAKRVLQKDRHHLFIVFLFKGSQCVGIQGADFEDRAAKFAYSRELAGRVAVEGITGIAMVGEVWESGAVWDEEGGLVPPEEVPDRREALQVYAEDNTGEYRVKTCYFRKRFGRIHFEEERESRESLESNFMAPS